MKNYWQRSSVSPYKLKFICGYKIFPLKENFAQAKLKVTLVISVIRDIHICGINKIKTYLILKVGSVLTEVFTYFHVAVKIKPITLKYFTDFKKIQSHLKINSLFLKETLLNLFHQSIRPCHVNVKHACYWEAFKSDNLLNYPTNIYLLKLYNRNTRKKCEICSKLTIKTPKRSQWRCSGLLTVNFEHISHLFFSVSIVDFEQVNVCWVRVLMKFVQIIINTRF